MCHVNIEPIAEVLGAVLREQYPDRDDREGRLEELLEIIHAGWDKEERIWLPKSGNSTTE